MTDKTRIGRLPERGTDDLEVIYKILDQGLICHAAYLIDERPVVIPTLYVRDGDQLLLHGSVEHCGPSACVPPGFTAKRCGHSHRWAGGS